MVFGVYAIRDAHTGFLTPTFEQNDQVAMRNFAHAVTRGDSVLQSSAKDFDLYRLGSFDASDGTFICGDLPAHLVSAVSLL